MFKEFLHHLDKVVGTIVYMELERRLGKTRHGSLMGLVWNLLCGMMVRLKKTKPGSGEKEEG